MAVKIMIDPGHFQNVNPGAATGYYEGNQMWILSGYLKQYLESHGFIVGMTKKTINDYPKTSAGEDNITARGHMAKGYDLFISMHSNAAASAYVDRPVGIYFVDDNCGQADEVSYAVAKLLASTVEKVMETQTYQVFSKLSSGDRDGDGYRNDDYYGALFGAHQVGVAGVILEHSFHTNKAAAQWLLSDTNLKTLAKAEAEAIAEYYGVKTTGWQKDAQGWWYRDADGGYPRDCWRQIGGQWYFFDCDGYMLSDTEFSYTGKIYVIDESGHVVNIRDKEETTMEKRFYKLGEITSEHYRPTIDKLMAKGVLKGKGGEGEETVIDLGEDAIRMLVILDRQGVFGA